MNPYTGEKEYDTFIEGRLANLNPVLVAATKDDRLFDDLGQKLAVQNINAEIIEHIKYETLLILLQIEPLDDLLGTLSTEYELDPTQTVNAAETVENALKDYRQYLEDVPEMELPEELEAGEGSEVELSNPPTSLAVDTPIPVKPAQPPMLHKKEEIIGARTMQGDIATLKKEEDKKPFIPAEKKPGEAAPEAAKPANEPTVPPKRPLSPPPLVRGNIPEGLPTDQNVPRYAKPLTDMPRYTNLK